MTVPRTLLALLIGFNLLGGTTARAGHRTDLTSAFDQGNPYDFNLQVGYNRSLKRGAIKRELAGQYGDKVRSVKDLRFSQVRHTLSIRGEFAIFRDLQLHVEFPIILQDTRTLDFAENDGDSCGSPREKYCVTKFNSTLIRDGFLPKSVVNAMGNDQVAVAGPDPTSGMFGLPNRSGLDQFHLGLSWAPINQRRDPTKPTWAIGFEARIAVGAPMEHNPYWDSSPARDDDPTNPKGNDSVGRGLHELIWSTTISKRWRYIDPWMHFFYSFPVPSKDSLFNRTSFDLSGQERHNPQQTGGIEAGMEIVAWEQPAKDNKFTIEILTRLEGRFEGRGYSEMWEVFANNPVLAGPCRPSPTSVFNSPSKWNNGTYCTSNVDSDIIPYPGISRIENHAAFKAALALNLDFSKFFRARVGVSLGHEQQHYITFGDAGRDIDDQPGITYTREDEVNPLYRPFIDSVGRRFRVAETTVFDFFAALEGRF